MTDTYELEIDIAAPRERVWGALTDPRDLEAWFCEHADVSLDDKRYDFWGRYTQGTPDRDAGRHQVLEVDPLHRLRFQFLYDGAETTVEVTLESDTTVRVVHSDVAERRAGSQMLPRHLWSGALGQLRAYLEVDRPGPRFDYTWPTTGGFSIEAELDASPAQVFDALRDAWTDEQYLRPARSDDEDFAWDVGALVGIKMLDLVPSERMEVAWIQDTPTTLTYTLSDVGSGTRFTLVHSGFGGETDEQGMAEGFFEGLVDIYWRLTTDAAWPPPSTKLHTPFPQSGWRRGVRVLQSA